MGKNQPENPLLKAHKEGRKWSDLVKETGLHSNTLYHISRFDEKGILQMRLETVLKLADMNIFMLDTITKYPAKKD